MLLSELPADRQELWPILDQFIARWFLAQPTAADITEESLVSAATRLGVPIPAALCEWFLRYRARSDVWSLQDELLLPDEWRLHSGILVIARENQGVVQWGIKAQSLRDDDPPVWVSSPSEPSNWSEASPRVSQYALHSAVLNAQFSDAPPFNANGGMDDDGALMRLRSAYPRLPLRDTIWPADPTYVLGTDEILVEVQADTWVWAVALTEDAMADFRQLVGPSVHLRRADE